MPHRSQQCRQPLVAGGPSSFSGFTAFFAAMHILQHSQATSLAFSVFFCLSSSLVPGDFSGSAASARTENTTNNDNNPIVSIVLRITQSPLTVIGNLIQRPSPFGQLLLQLMGTAISGLRSCVRARFRAPPRFFRELRPGAARW